MIACVSPQLEYESGAVLPPWETVPYGVVSLLAMLEFAAAEFVEATHTLGLILGEAKRPTQTDRDLLNPPLHTLLSNCDRLGLTVTLKQIGAFVMEIAKECPGAVKLYERGFEVMNGKLPPERNVYHVEAIYTTLRAELAGRKFKAIPPEKERFCDPKWLLDSIMFSKFPDTVDEFQRAGRCFSYGENTACIFHLMRVADFYFNKVGESLGIAYEARAWMGIGHKITEKMEQKHHTKTDEWKQKEPFYAEILTDIQSISRGHRNAALHELEKKYDEREANYMLTVIEGFARHVAEKL